MHPSRIFDRQQQERLLEAQTMSKSIIAKWGRAHNVRSHRASPPSPHLLPEKRNFKANWSCLEVVAVAVITLAVGESAAAAYGPIGVGPVLKTTAFGVVNLVWLSALKYSTRNCACRRSLRSGLRLPRAHGRSR